MAYEMLVPAQLPMRPWEYIRRRRLLAGLTIEQAARRYWWRGAADRPELATVRASCERNLRDFERRGLRIRTRGLVALLNRAFPVDPAVYEQLAHEPADRHPTICLCCASSVNDPRLTRDGALSRLDDDSICTACREDQAHSVVGWAA